MSDQDIYAIARRRIDQRNRRWMLWGADFLGFLVYVGAFLALYNTIPRSVGVMIALAWFGVLVLHAFAIGMAQNRDEAVEKEVAKLREAGYEKPKRLELSEDGELLDADEFDDLRTDKRRGDWL